MLNISERLKATFFVGIAIFSMVFGAGNLVFPVSIGNFVGNNFLAAFLGIFVGSVLIPMAGLLSCLAYQGSYTRFLQSWVGRLGATLLTIFAMLILGPLGCIPRCSTLAHAALSWQIIPGISLFWFSLAFFGLSFLLSYREDQLVNILGRFLGPINLLFMATLIIKGTFFSNEQLNFAAGGLQDFRFGFVESQKTFDLLGMVFYSGAIVVGVATYLRSALGIHNKEEVLSFCRRGTFIAAGLFSLIYAGFCTMAALNTPIIPKVSREMLISAYSTALLGSKLGAIAGMIVFIACLNSVCTLSVVFSRYLVRLFEPYGVGYVQCLCLTTIIGFGFSNLGFSGIDRAIMPAMTLAYPVLIIVSLLGVAGLIASRLRTRA